MISRDGYIEKIISWKDKKMIKVLTGMRRVGKSTLLLLYKDYLLKNGVDKNNIIYINLEDLKYDYIKDYNNLYDEIINKLNSKKKNYVMIDEIQNVDKFEKAIDSLYLKDNVDIYLTGSNAKFLSSEIATVLSGRYIEINVLPLSFKEYISDENVKNKNLNELFNNYLLFGGMPFVKSLDNDKDEINKYLESVYNTVYKKDILKRVEIRNNETLEKISKFMFDNISNITSVNKIANALKSNGVNISNPTVDSYIDTLSSAYLFYKINRYDVKGKNILTSQYKYYTVDIGLRNYIVGMNNRDLGRILENVVYLELIRRGYKVYIGKIDNVEIDFIAVKSDETIYYQVAQSIIDEKTFDREIKPLTKIKNNYEKCIITMDSLPKMNNDGIKVINVIDFLKG